MEIIRKNITIIVIGCAVGVAYLLWKQYKTPTTASATTDSSLKSMAAQTVATTSNFDGNLKKSPIL